MSGLPEDGAGVMEETEFNNGLRGRVDHSWRLLKQGRRPRRTVHYLSHSWKLRSLSRSLAEALGESWEASSWPGDRLEVGVELSEKVERLTRLLNRETEVHGRLVALLK
jgi:predicted ArsR family transcriptional regulator